MFNIYTEQKNKCMQNKRKHTSLQEKGLLRIKESGGVLSTFSLANDIAVVEGHLTDLQDSLLYGKESRSILKQR